MNQRAIDSNHDSRAAIGVGILATLWLCTDRVLRRNVRRKRTHQVVHLEAKLGLSVHCLYECNES